MTIKSTITIIALVATTMLTSCTKDYIEYSTEDCSCGVIVGDTIINYQIYVEVENFCSSNTKLVHLKDDINTDSAPDGTRCYSTEW